MREFKFRAWNKDLNEPRMEYFNLFDISRTFDGGMGHKYSIDDKDRVGVYGSIIRIENIMQFTGLKDSKGKEIYEGDIVVFDGETYQVEYCDNHACGKYELMKYLKGRGGGLSTECDSWFATEIIGNIYENPKLK